MLGSRPAYMPLNNPATHEFVKILFDWQTECIAALEACLG